MKKLPKILTELEIREGDLSFRAKLYHKRRKAKVIGMTGPPGAGKSSLVDQLIGVWTKKEKKIAVIAVDPTSPFTGGGFLGDRVRMQRHAENKNVFIRSVGSRGSHGGIANITHDFVMAAQSFDFDYIIVETVGVGQTELDIMGVADTILVVLVPEAGDGVQSLKAGLSEIADIFVVNKADRKGAKILATTLESALQLGGEKKGRWSPKVHLTNALKGEGIDELIRLIGKHHRTMASGQLHQNRKELFRKEYFLNLCLAKIKKELLDKIEGDKELNQLYKKIAKGTTNPYKALEKILFKLE